MVQKYTPMPWNDGKHIQYNNCYSYAMNQPEPDRTSKRIPGESSNLNRDKNNYTCSHYTNAVLKRLPMFKYTGTDPRTFENVSVNNEQGIWTKPQWVTYLALSNAT